MLQQMLRMLLGLATRLRKQAVGLRQTTLS
jgi:hypothetical protein